MLPLVMAAVSAQNAAAPNPYPNCTNPSRQSEFSVAVLARDPMPDNRAFVSHVNGSSDFTFNFATAWFPAPGSRTERGAYVSDTAASASEVAVPTTEGLVVRVVECSPNHHPCPNATHPEWSNAGAVTIVPASLPAAGPLMASHITYGMVSWNGATPPPRSNTSKWGAADPRITYREHDQTYYLTWDNCTQNCYPHRITYLSTTKNPHDPDGWTWHGQVFPFPYTSGASLLFRDDAEDVAAGNPHLAFVCKSNTANQILLAESHDGVKWDLPSNSSKAVFMAGRPDCWDKDGVAAGAQPERLSNGDYLYVYNIDTGFPYKPNPLGRCAIGWAILDGNDPTTIIARSEEPLLVATEEWETCADVGKGYKCQEPEVVFTTGMKPLGNDEFLVFYGAADSDVGVSKIKVNIHSFS